MSRVLVAPYSAEWPVLFEAAREALLSAFMPVAVAIEHIGSTAVPGLAAKPVIDVLLGAGTLAEIESKIGALRDIGYDYVSKYERELPLRRYFVKSSEDSLRIHLHAVERGSRFWREQLLFRDALRADADLSERYRALKLRLAETHAEDKSAYTAAKGPFIQATLASLAASDGGG